MSTTHADLSMSSLSLNAGEAEDWDRSLNLSDGARTPRNSVAFPAGANAGAGTEEARDTPGRDKRTLSELLKLHSEKGKDVTFSPEEASRIAEVLGQWVSIFAFPPHRPKSPDADRGQGPDAPLACFTGAER